MKKIFTIAILALLSNIANAQIQTIYNNNFEQLNANGTISHWGNIYLIPMWIDSNGNAFADSIVYDNQYYAPTTDAYSGTHALELRNAWNFTTNTGIPGAVGNDEDTVFSAWGLFNPVPTYGTLFTPFSPINFGFYYKYFPVNGDSAFIQIALFDSSSNQIGEGTAIITGTQSNYTQIITPVNYSMLGFVASYSFTISNFYSVAPGSHSASFGTRLLVDAIGFNYAAVSGITSINNNDAIKLYPNPASEQLNIQSAINSEKPFYMYNVFGQLVMQGWLPTTHAAISLENMSDGFYTIELPDVVKTERHSFIVKK